MFKQAWLLAKINLKADFSSKERLVSPFLFSLITLILFAFAFGMQGKDAAAKLLVAQSFLTLFFTLQLVFARSFEFDFEDGFFDLVRARRVNPISIFCGKALAVFCFCFMICIPLNLFASVMLGVDDVAQATLNLSLLIALALVGLIPLGMLLALITSGTGNRHILYPLLYFPLTTPALLSGVQSGLELMTTKQGQFGPWLNLLVVFDVIYITLGIVLFIEFLSPKNSN